ncbi:LLM class flavin-dependent oxidoreductase [Rhodoligotrophos appendicifer]|uniref:LLM class flavin-dependent oxidoreductase n=1 Tax=Rhodoligotrophos appendicifer TaxID=987056 RepID=UPI0011801D3B|nr:LLM class flavin-dependent oxidoreductase [Rhodoligotrophos appendicifer]
MLPEKHIGVCLLTTTPAKEMIDLAVLADQKGLDGFWIAEGYHYFRNLGEPSSSTSLAAAMAMVTSRITIGLGIVPPYTRHPGLLAMECHTTSRLSDGRFIMGLGAAKAAALHMGWTEKTMRAAPTIRESIGLVRELLDGRPVDYHGEIYKLDAPATPDKQLGQVPIAIGATGPLMIKLGGEIADIVLLPTFTSPGFVTLARELIAQGAAKSQRSADTIPVGGTLPFSVAEDEASARAAIRRLTVVYVANKVQNIKNDTLLKAAGVDEDEVKKIAACVKNEGPDSAAKMLSDDLMDKVAIAGTPTQVTDRLLEFADAGLRWPLLYGVLGPDRREAIKLIAERVRPAFMAN